MAERRTVPVKGAAVGLPIALRGRLSQRHGVDVEALMAGPPWADAGGSVAGAPWAAGASGSLPPISEQAPWVATSPHASAVLGQVDLPAPCVWVLGHEGQGVAPAIMQRCQLTVRIPQPGGEESLNVAAAAAICLYESARQRGG